MTPEIRRVVVGVVVALLVGAVVLLLTGNFGPVVFLGTSVLVLALVFLTGERFQ